jgi:hypothetical protein
MDWSNLAYVALLAGFVLLMMRGCGGGKCGMGHRRNDGNEPADSNRDRRAA